MVMCGMDKKVMIQSINSLREYLFLFHKLFYFSLQIIDNFHYYRYQVSL
jgi:hypothetical protein